MPVTKMNLIDRLIGFEGKANRIEYSVILTIAIALLILASFIPAAAATLAISTAFFLIISASIRRLHDINVSVWYLLIALTPYVGQFFLLSLCVMPSRVQTEKSILSTESTSQNTSNEKVFNTFCKVVAVNGFICFGVLMANGMSCDSPQRGEDCGYMALLAQATFIFFAFVVPTIALKLTMLTERMRMILIISAPVIALAADLLFLNFFIFK